MSDKDEGSVTHHDDIHKYHDEGIAGLQQDEIAVEARGRMAQEMPKGYYRSPRFIGTYLVRTTPSHLLDMVF